METIDWRRKCVDEFSLKVLPWEGVEVRAWDATDNETWKRYHSFRTKCTEHSCTLENSTFADDESDSIAASLRSNWMKDFRSEAEDVGEAGRDWFRATSSEIHDSRENDMENGFSVGEFGSTVFSPYTIPRAIELRHRAHLRSGWSSVAFSLTWKFKMIRFDGYLGGDAEERRLADLYPEEAPHFKGKAVYEPRTKFEVLCSNGFVEPPLALGPSSIVEDIFVDNFSTTIVRRLREWIYGVHHFRSRELIGDFDLLRLLFAAFGSPKFKVCVKEIGHTSGLRWNSDVYKQLVKDGVIEEDETVGISWLEHRVRLISGSLRSLDLYYEPFDVMEAKKEWGLHVLREKSDRDIMNGDDDDDESQELLGKAPWIVWELADQ